MAAFCPVKLFAVLTRNKCFAYPGLNTSKSGLVYSCIKLTKHTTMI